MTDWGEMVREMERLLRLRTFPVAYKRLEKAEEQKDYPRIPAGEAPRPGPPGLGKV